MATLKSRRATLQRRIDWLEQSLADWDPAKPGARQYVEAELGALKWAARVVDADHDRARSLL